MISKCCTKCDSHSVGKIKSAQQMVLEQLDDWRKVNLTSIPTIMGYIVLFISPNSLSHMLNARACVCVCFLHMKWRFCNWFMFGCSVSPSLWAGFLRPWQAGSCSLGALHRPLALASLAAELGLQAPGLQWLQRVAAGAVAFRLRRVGFVVTHRIRFSAACGHVLDQGSNPSVSPALAGRLLSTLPPGKSNTRLFKALLEMIKNSSQPLLSA